jgi:hypothetical protein
LLPGIFWFHAAGVSIGSINSPELNGKSNDVMSARDRPRRTERADF